MEKWLGAVPGEGPGEGLPLLLPMPGLGPLELMVVEGMDGWDVVGHAEFAQAVLCVRELRSRSLSPTRACLNVSPLSAGVCLLVRAD